MKIRLQAKFVILFLIYSAILFVLQFVAFLIIGAAIYVERYEDYLSKLEDITIYELQITPEELHYYGRTQNEDERYREILSHMKQIQSLSGTACFYIIYPMGEGKAIWLFDTSENGQMLGDEVTDYADDQSETVRDTYQSGERGMYTTMYDEDPDNDVVSVFSPLKDAEDNTIAVLGADVYVNDIAYRLTNMMLVAGALLLGLMAMGMAMLLLFVQFAIVHAIRRLKQGVEKMMEGELGVEIPIRRKDEIGEITETFNRMSAAIKRHMSEMQELNRAYQKFVPGDTLEILHKDSVVDVELGNQEQVRMAVLSIEACSFEEATRDMSSKETFLYINEKLKAMVPVVAAHGGVIAQFERAGICSYYREGIKVRAQPPAQGAKQSAAQLALQSALQICEKSGEDEFAAGIAEGTVMVGIAGHSQRMNIISISREKRLSELLMQIAPKYRASVLISRYVQEQIPGFAESYHARFLGYIRLSQQLVGVYDVFDGDRPEDRQFKQMTKEQFEQGVALFGAGNYLEARQAFVSVLRQYRRDEAAKVYIERCSRLMQEGEKEAEVWLEAF